MAKILIIAGCVMLAAGLLMSWAPGLLGWFGRLPREGCEVLAVEPHAEQESPPAFYVMPSADGSRPGRYYINTYDPASRHLHRMAGIAFHEAVPGHHFQLAINQELADLPAFRRFGARLAAAPLSRRCTWSAAPRAQPSSPARPLKEASARL